MAKKKTRPENPPRPLLRLTDRERGVAAFERGDYEGAIQAWSAQARREPPDEALRRALAEAHFRRACSNLRAESALNDIQTANTYYPGDPLYLYHLGLAHHRGGQLKAAISAYRESIGLDPRHYARTAAMLCLAVAETGGDPAREDTWELLTPEQQNRLKPKLPALKNAIKALSNGDFDAAEPHLHSALNHAIAFCQFYLALIAYRRGQKRETLARLLAAKANGLNTPALRLNLLRALTERALDHVENADVLPDAVRQALKIAPESPILLKLKQRADFLAGNAAAETGDWNAALRHWVAAKRAGAAPRDLIANIALAHERLDQWAEAAEAWREFVRRRPRRGEQAWTPGHIARLWRHIDALYARDGQFGRAAASLRYAVKAQPDDLALKIALIGRYLEQQNARSASQAALRVLEIAPKNAEALMLYAQACEMEGDLDQSLDAWERVDRTTNAPYAALARNRLAILYAARADLHRADEDSRAAANDYTKALEFTPDDALLYARRGAALAGIEPKAARADFERLDLTNDDLARLIIEAWHAVGDHAEARRWLKRRENHAPLPPEALVDVGIAILGKGAAGAEYFTAALAGGSDGQRPILLTRIAAAYYAQGESSAAYDHARRALKEDATYGVAHLHLGMWDAAKGRRAAALDHLEKAAAWARTIRRRDIQLGIDEAINLLNERYTPTLEDVLDSIDPDGTDGEMRRLLGWVG
ncbi:MAG: tetratricopeptide repeat protein [Anaerolineales bacterium]|nr:tetratricopeptide repeat protein [Anaerolineales bacterium]